MLREETKHHMTRRRSGWDYCAPASYMVTLSLADRSRDWLGTLEPCEQARRITLSPLGAIVEEEWLALAANWPGVETGPFVVMPEHFHGIIKIRERQSHPLGQIIGSFKAKTTSRARGLGNPASKLAGPMVMAPASPAPEARVMVPASLLAGSSLWSPGLCDSILWGRERYERAAAYIADNPRRLAAKRENPGLFTVRRDIAIPLVLGGAAVEAHFSAVGNNALLARLDFHQVQCSRRFFAYRRDQYGKPLKDAPPAVETPEFRERLEEALAEASAGAVLVDPCISQGEREIARRAFAAGAAVVTLKNQGFSPLFKPEGALFDACDAGRLLLLAPAAWPFTGAKKPMTREDACTLNRLAQALAGDGAAQIDYKGRQPLFIDQDAIKAVTPIANQQQGSKL